MTAAPVMGPLPAERHYTRWSNRVLAFVIDWTPIWLVFIVPMSGIAITEGTACVNAMYGSSVNLCAGPTADFWSSVQFVGLLAAAVYFFWNLCHRQGRTGQSIGKSAMKFKVVSERTGEPIGFGMSFARQLAHYVDQLVCYAGYLRPLWNGKRQTFADHIVGTVCVPVATAALD